MIIKSLNKMTKFNIYFMSWVVPSIVNPRIFSVDLFHHQLAI